jgi:hypothetical protein
MLLFLRLWRDNSEFFYTGDDDAIYSLKRIGGGEAKKGGFIALLFLFFSFSFFFLFFSPSASSTISRRRDAAVPAPVEGHQQEIPLL